MAKFTLLFVVIFCIVQIALCARVKREDEATTPGTLDKIGESLNVDKLGEKLNTGLDATKQAFESTFTKENAEKVGTALKEVGETFLDKIKKAFE
uniref:CSON008485 protein n=1 Tax=Culicoides sonorensis TaxID=179676 RepID=A0A336LZ05_CULSO